VKGTHDIDQRSEGPAPGRRRSGAAPPHLFYGYVITASGFFIWTIGWGTYTTCFAVFLKPLLEEFGWTRAQASLAYSISFLVQAAMGICAGWLNDKLGPRTVVVFLGSFLGLCYILMSQIHSLWQFQINYAVMGGIGTSVLAVPVMATLARWFQKRRGLMTGVVQTGSSIGGLLSAPFAGWLILNYGWRSAYVVLGLFCLAGMIAAGLFLKGDPRDVGELPDGENATATPLPEPERSSLSSSAASSGRLSRTKAFWMLAGLYASFGFCRSAFMPHLTAHAQDLGFSLVDGANILAVLAGASILGRLGMGRLGDAIGNLPAFTISFASTTAVLVFGLTAHRLWELYLFAFIFGFAWGAEAVLRFSATSEVLGLGSLGLFMGILSFAESLAAAFGTFIAGYIFDLVGDYFPAFWMGIAVAVTGTTLSWRLSPSSRKGRA